MSRVRIGVLASGGGSNLQAILDHQAMLGEARHADVVLVASNRPDAGALTRAERAGIATALVQSPHAPDGDEMGTLFRTHRVSLVVLAGYMRHVPLDVTRAYHGLMLNVHPALLPAFGGEGMYGARVHRAVIASGASFSGPTVHFVDEQYDHGPVIAQWAVPVLPGDDDRTLAARVLRAEHLLYPRVVEAVAAGEASLGPDGVVRAGPFARPLPVMDPTLDNRTLAATLDHSSSSSRLG